MGQKVDAVLYGTVVLYKANCPKCNRKTFLDNGGYTLCCESRVKIDQIGAVKRRSEAYWRRKKPTKKRQEEILEKQQYKCIYCSADLNHETEINFDHFVPWTWCADNHSENFVASCRLCNAMKHNKLFGSVKEVRTYVKKRRIGRKIE